mgnify:CR=1 FL=1
MSRHPVLNDHALEIVARRFAVLAEPMRLRLIQAYRVSSTFSAPTPIRMVCNLPDAGKAR